MNDILPMRAGPVAPEVTMVARTRNGAGWMTAVTRLWPRGTGYCGLCPRERCTALRDACLVAVEGHLTMEQAERLSTHDRPWFDEGGSGPGAGFLGPNLSTRNGA